MRFFILAILFVTSLAKDDKYKRFADLMAKYKYTWDAIKVKTDDGFILTTFHITGNQHGYFKPTKPPVLIQHGSGMDAAYWMAYYSEGHPMPLQLADAGYDVYMGNNRGSLFSQEHVSLNVDDPAFWQWSWAELGRYDDIANIKMIQERSGQQKIFYLGHSQGTTQMFYALAHLEESFLAASLHKFVALAPCYLFNIEGDTKGESYYYNGLYAYPKYGVYDLWGPNWPVKSKKLCEKLGKKGCEVAEFCSPPDCGPTSVQAEVHYMQNAFMGRFQEYAPNYLKGEKMTQLIDIASIDKVPISMLVGTNDTFCTPQRAQEMAEIIGERVVDFELIEGADHEWFCYGNDDQFMGKLFEQLQVEDNGILGVFSSIFSSVSSLFTSIGDFVLSFV